MADRDQELRLDKWLWAARLFKTRSLAAEAVDGGKVAINGTRPKPSRAVRIGDEIEIRRGPYNWTIVVKDISHLRGPSPQAHSLFEESAESIEKRAAAIAQMKLEQPAEFDRAGRPSKKERRAITRLTKPGW